MSTLRVAYQTFEFGDIDIHVRTLRDNQQFQDDNGVAEKLGISSAMWPLFGLVWPAGQVLAHHLLEFDIADKRILEVGCGIGLSSLLLNHLKANITATDFHPEVAAFLAHNVAINNGSEIPFVRSDWAEHNLELKTFDLIIGSDLLYEDQHINLLADFVLRHASEHCTLVLVDPGRGRHAKFSKKMESLGFSANKVRANDTSFLTDEFTGWVLEYHR